MMSRKRSGFGVAAVMALLAGGCSDGGGTQATPGGAGGSGGPGGAAGKGGASGSGGEADGGAGKPSCDGTQTTDPKFAQAMQVLRDQLAKSGIPGGAIAIIKDGKLVDLGVAGSKRASVCDPITPDTLFRVQAATWGITTLAALRAVEDGKLSLTGPITDVVPTLTVSNGAASQIRLRDLLTGSGNYYSDNLGQTNQGTGCLGALAGVFTNATNPVLMAKPGTMPDEMFLNFELAGLALQNADGKPFVDAVKARVLKPLSMGGAFDVATILASDHAVGHKGSVEAPPERDCPNTDPSVGYHGSISDVAKLAAYLTGGPGGILPSATLDAMLSEQGPSFGSLGYWSYGFQGFKHAGVGGELLSNGITGNGFQSELRIYKQRGLSVITLVNSEALSGPIYTSFWPVTLVNDAVARIYDPSLVPLTELQNPVYVPVPASLPSLVGKYRDTVGVHGTGPRTLDIVLDPADSGTLAGTLSGADGSSVAVALAGEWSADNFSMGVGGANHEARFWRDAAGNGSAVQIYAGNGPVFFRVP